MWSRRQTRPFCTRVATCLSLCLPTVLCDDDDGEGTAQHVQQGPTGVAATHVRGGGHGRGFAAGCDGRAVHAAGALYFIIALKGSLRRGTRSGFRG